MKQELPWAGKCICNYAVCHLLLLLFLLLPRFFVFFLLLFRAAHHRPGPVTGFIHLCQGGVAEAMRAAAADVVHLLKI